MVNGATRACSWGRMAGPEPEPAEWETPGTGMAGVTGGPSGPGARRVRRVSRASRWGMISRRARAPLVLGISPRARAGAGIAVHGRVPQRSRPARVLLLGAPSSCCRPAVVRLLFCSATAWPCTRSKKARPPGDALFACVLLPTAVPPMPRRRRRPAPVPMRRLVTLPVSPSCALGCAVGVICET